jgi:hypothetical protein
MQPLARFASVRDLEGRVPATDQARDSFGEYVAAALPGLLRFGHVLTGDARKAED